LANHFLQKLNSPQEGKMKEDVKLDPAGEGEPAQGKSSALRIWDSSDYAPKDVFARLSEEVCRNSAWAPLHGSKEDPLHARFEQRPVLKGFVSRVRCSFLDLETTRSSIARSSPDCYSGCIILSGSMGLIWEDAQRVVNPGDILVHDSTYPLKVCSGSNLELIAFAVEKGVTPSIDKNSDLFRRFVTGRDNISAPLRNCLYFLGERLTGDDQELNAVFDATLSLLPVDAGCFNSEGFALTGKIDDLYLSILSFCDKSLQNPCLSAKLVADAFGISERYVYKLFAEHGLRYGAYVRSRRIQRAANELTTAHRARITDVAYKWGFGDLSTFIRAFKKKFGCSPREFRARF
jgi:AraC family transcriptional regulator, positive regulator of tynA and feaB